MVPPHPDVSTRAPQSNGAERDVEFVGVGATSTDDIDQAYRDKYRRHGGSYVDAMISADAATTTLRLVPQSA